MKTKIFLSIALSCMLGQSAFAQDQEQEICQDSVNVAYQTVAKEDVWGAISYINMKDVAGINHYNYSLDYINCYTAGVSGGIWNQGNLLVLVDGFARDEYNIDQSEIEQITILKGAQAVALYGTKAANGVILITTKKGKNEDMRISANANYSLYTPISYPKYLSSGEYMILYNEARENDGIDPMYDAQTIYNYVNNVDKDQYPNLDLYSDDYVRNVYDRWDANVEIRGGGTFAQFYSNIGYYRNTDLLNFGESEKNFTSRLNIRGNIDLKINNFISGFVHSHATFYDDRHDNSNFWAATNTLRPERIQPLISIDRIDEFSVDAKDLVNNSLFLVDGKYFLNGNAEQETNAVADMYAKGYSKYTSRQLEFDMGINFDLSKAVQGLKFNTMFAGDYRNNYTNTIRNEYRVFIPSWTYYNGPAYISSLDYRNVDKRTGIQNMESSNSMQLLTACADFTYNRIFSEKHAVNAILLANCFQQSTAGSYHKTSSANIGLQARYTFDKRYMVDFSSSMVHSAKLPEDNRNALSPVVTLGWRLSQESFLKDASWLDDMQISASYGIINQDIDIADYYMYSSNINTAGNWWGWRDGVSKQSTQYEGSENLDFDFVKNKQINVGLNATFLDGMLSFNANYFNIKNEGLPIKASILYPSYFSNFIATINYNNRSRQGVDFSVNFKKQFGDVKVGLGINGMYAKSEHTKYAENVEEGNEHLKNEGHSLDAIRGLVAEGFFQSEEEIEEAIANGYQSSWSSDLKPGDLKYVDQNNDGIINDKDRIDLGQWRAKFVMGANLSVSYKNFTLFVAATGNWGGKNFKSDSYMVFGERKYTDVVRNRWTPETAQTATYPRLTTVNDNGNNYRSSTFWLYKTDRFDINKVQITYDFPQSILGNGVVKDLSVYVYGTSLATFAKEKDYMLTNIGLAPQCRSFNVGVKVGF